MMIKKSIFSRVFLLMLAVSLAVGSFVLAMTLRQQAISSEDLLIQEYFLLAKVVSRSIEAGYLANLWPLETLKLINDSENILFFWIVRPDGEIFFADDPNLTGRIVDESFIGSEETAALDSFDPDSGERIKVIVYPLKINAENKVWNLALGISLKPVMMVQRKMIINGIALLFIVIILAAIVSFYFTRGVTDSLRRLREGVRIIGKGDLDHHIELKTGDEIEELAGEFNRMTDKIKQVRQRDKVIGQMKSDFISLAAHQLRTPLAAVKWTLRMILDGDVGKITSKQMQMIERGYQSNERMITLVNDLLNVTRIEEGRFLSAFDFRSMEEMIEEAIASFREQIKRKRIKVTFKKPTPPAPRIKVDAEKIYLVIQNLLNNAIRYNHDRGKVAIALTYDKENVEVMIKDNGIGIPKHQQRRLFDKFFRASNAIKKETSGTGLGLFICKNVIEAHGGKIWFKSVRDKGTTFWFTLPVIQKYDIIGLSKNL